MSSDKKDLTRIEDLGEFIHELNSESDLTSDDAFSSELPDLPSSDDDEVPAFDSPTENDESSGGLDFGTTEEFPTSDFEGSASDFTTSFDAPPSEPTGEFKSEDFSNADFKTDDFKSEDFKTDEFKSDDFKTEDEPSWNTDVPLTQNLEKDEDLFSEPEPVKEPEPVYVPPAVTAKEQEYKTPETFEDLKKVF